MSCCEISFFSCRKTRTVGIREGSLRALAAGTSELLILARHQQRIFTAGPDVPLECQQSFARQRVDVGANGERDSMNSLPRCQLYDEYARRMTVHRRSGRADIVTRIGNLTGLHFVADSAPSSGLDNVALVCRFLSLSSRQTLDLRKLSASPTMSSSRSDRTYDPGERRDPARLRPHAH